MLVQWPAELVLGALSYLQIPELRRLMIVSRDWRDFFNTNESSIYHHAALLHEFVASRKLSLSEAKAVYPDRSMVNVDSWKAFCERRWRIERGWIGQEASSVKHYSAVDGTHRFKVDEQAGYIISTLQRGGLLVADLASNEILWSLTQHDVPIIAHCEYGNGFLVFNRDVEGDALEVWRRACDYDPEHVPQVSPPDGKQMQASLKAAQSHPSVTDRGHFKPWAVLNSPVGSYAFRVVYPALLVANDTQAYIWDLPTAQLSQVIEDIDVERAGQVLGRVNWVELNYDYVFICGTNQLRVFARPTGRLVYYLDCWQLSYAHWKLDLCPYRLSATPEVFEAALIPQALAVHDDVAHRTDNPSSDSMISCGMCKAVLVSGPDMVVALWDEKLLLIRNFERVVNGSLSLADAALEIDTYSRGPIPPMMSSRYLTFEHGRVGVATLDGIYVITLYSDIHALGTANDNFVGGTLPANHPSFGNISVCRVSGYRNRSALQSLSCLQMTDTGLFFTYSRPDPQPEKICTIYRRPLMKNFRTHMDDFFGPDLFEGLGPDEGDGILDGPQEQGAWLYIGNYTIAGALENASGPDEDNIAASDEPPAQVASTSTTNFHALTVEQDDPPDSETAEPEDTLPDLQSVSDFTEDDLESRATPTLSATLCVDVLPRR